MPMSKIFHHSKVARTLASLNRIQAEEHFTARTRSQYLGSNKLLCQILGEYKFFVSGDDVGLASHLLFDGYWEFWLTKFFADRIKPGDTVIDIGANLGYYSVLAADLVGPEGRMVAVEPNPAMFDLLRQSLQVNGFSARSDLRNIALGGDESGSMPFFVPRGEPKNGRFISANEDRDWLSRNGSIFDVKAESLSPDDYARVDFIKIDVEGAEVMVLDEIAPLIERFKPLIVCEVNFSRGYSYSDIVDRLGENGALKHLDFHSKVKPLTEQMTRTERKNDDWLVVANV